MHTLYLTGNVITPAESISAAFMNLVKEMTIFFLSPNNSDMMGCGRAGQKEGNTYVYSYTQYHLS